jgi:hypothetical protein
MIQQQMLMNQRNPLENKTIYGPGGGGLGGPTASSWPGGVTPLGQELRGAAVKALGETEAGKAVTGAATKAVMGAASKVGGSAGTQAAAQQMGKALLAAIAKAI